MKIFHVAFVFCAALLASACLPVSTKSPIGTTQGFVPDSSLMGTWKGVTPGEKVASWFHFLPGREGTVMAVVVTPSNDEDQGGWGAFALQTVKLGGNYFMNAQEVSDNGTVATDKTAQNTTPLLYKISDDGKLTLYMLDEKAVAAEIKAGKIAGTVEPGQDGDVSITAEPDDLDAFFQTPEGIGLFSKKFAVLTPVNDDKPDDKPDSSKAEPAKPPNQ